MTRLGYNFLDDMDMSQTNQIILSLLVLIGFYFLAKKIYDWRIKRALFMVIEDLKQKGAFDPNSAVDLLYAKTSITKTILQLKMKDFRPKAVEHLIIQHIVGMTEIGRYYLKKEKTIEKSPVDKVGDIL